MSAREEVADPYSENRRWNTAARWFLAMALGFSALGYLTGFLAFGALGVHAEYALVAGCSLLSLVGLAVIAVFLFAPHRLLPSCAEKACHPGQART